MLHSTEGPTAEGAARYFTQPQSGGSANLVLDDKCCFRTLGDLVIPYAAPPLNTHGFHIEQAGFARWTRPEWLQHRVTVERAAWKAALRCRWYKIPALLLTVDELKADFGTEIEGGVPVHQGPLHGGIVTHQTISRAYGLSDHTDPGAGYPLDLFLHLLRSYLAGGEL